jgi:GntR family transcriptional repressor for pyruvate dehydrogenase complex
MTRFKPIRQLRVSEEIADQIKQAILIGHFKLGDKLPAERNLAEEFDVSRVAIREALRKLEHSGFIVTRQGATGGAYVSELTFEYSVHAFLDLFLAGKISIPEMTRVRILVEPEIARLAALNIIPGYAQRLQDALNDEELPVDTVTEDVIRKQKVHLILAEMCGNRFFEAIDRGLMSLTKNIVEACEAFPQLHPVGMHRPIVEAVLAKDAEAAAEVMKKHSTEFGEILVEMEKAYRKKNEAAIFNRRMHFKK